MRISSSVVTTQILMGLSSMEMMRFTPICPTTWLRSRSRIMPMWASPSKMSSRSSAEFSPMPAVITTASVRVMAA